MLFFLHNYFPSVMQAGIFWHYLAIYSKAGVKIMTQAYSQNVSGAL
jgi:hypothetical protein